MTTQRLIPNRESLEDRVTPVYIPPTTFTVGTYGELVSALNTANSDGVNDIIQLAADIAYPGSPGDNGAGLLIGEAGHALTVTRDTGASVPARPTLDAAQTGRLFTATAGTVEFADVALTGGQYSGSGGTSGYGGAVYANAGTDLRLTRVTVTGNAARGYTLAVDAAGGAVYALGTVTIADSAFADNSAVGFSQPAAANGGPGFAGNSGGAGGTGSPGGAARGGAVYADFSLAVTGSVFKNNTATGGAGGTGGDGGPGSDGFNSPTGTPGGGGAGGTGADGGAAQGGAIYANSVTVYVTLLGTGNAVTGGAGGGGGDGGDGGRGLTQIGQSYYGAAGIGGNGGTGGAAQGGAVFVAGGATGDTVVGNSTVSGNAATGGTRGVSGGNGTGSGGTTFPRDGFFGLTGAGGVEVADGKDATLASTTVAYNRGGGVRLDSGSALTAYNSFVAQNDRLNVFGDAAAAGVTGQGNYFDSSQFYSPTDTANTFGGELPYNLAALAVNGTLAIDPAGTYFRLTHALNAGSPGVGKGVVAKLTADLIGPDTAHDGRGNAPRQGGGKTDPGSFELTVAAAPAGFTVAAPATATAGDPFDITVTAVDGNGTVVTGYTGPAAVTATVGGNTTTLVSALTFTAGVATASVAVPRSGTATLAVADAATPTSTGTTTLQVSPVAVSVTAASPQQVNGPFILTVTALDPNNVPATGYAGTASLAADVAGTQFQPASVTFVNGVATATVAVPTAGTVTLTAAVAGGPTGTAVVDVRNVGFRLDPPATAPTAGTPFSLTITAVDAAGQTDPAFQSDVALSYSPAGGTPLTVPGSAFVGGVATVSVTLPRAGAVSVTAVDPATGLVGSAAVSVRPVGLDVTVPATPPLAGQPFNVTITARDPGGATATGYAGTASLTVGSDPPTAVTFVNGVATQPVTVAAAGPVTVAAADGNLVGVTPVTVLPQRFEVTAPATVRAKEAFDVTVTPRNPDGSAAAFDGTATLTFTLGGATRTRTLTFVGGTAPPESVTPQATGTLVVVATADANAALTGGTSRTVQPAAAAAFRITVPANPPTAGVAFPITVTAVDVGGQPTTTFNGPVTLTSDPGGASFGPATLENGTATVSVTVPTAGLVGLTAKGGGVSSPVTPVSVVAPHVVLAAGALTAGTKQTFALTVVDAAGNKIADYNGPVTVSATTTTGVVFADFVADVAAGTGTFDYTPVEPGSVSFAFSRDGTALGANQLPVAAFGLVAAGNAELVNLSRTGVNGFRIGAIATGTVSDTDGAFGDEPVVSAVGGGSEVVSVLAANPNHIGYYNLPRIARETNEATDPTAIAAGSVTTPTGGTPPNDFATVNPAAGTVSLSYDALIRPVTNCPGYHTVYDAVVVPDPSATLDGLPVGDGTSVASGGMIKHYANPRVVYTPPLYGPPTLTYTHYQLTVGGTPTAVAAPPPSAGEGYFAVSNLGVGVQIVGISRTNDGGDYAFEVQNTLPVGTSENPSRLGDLTFGDLFGGTGRDLAVIDEAHRQVVLLQNSGGYAYTGREELTLPVGYAPRKVKVADLDGDGRADVAVAATDATGAGFVFVFYRTPPAAFGAADSSDKPQKYATAAAPSALVIADFDGDGRPDIATAGPTDGTVHLLVQRGAARSRSFSADIRLPLVVQVPDAAGGTVAYSPTGLIGLSVGDFNIDGRADVAALDQYSTVFVLHGIRVGSVPPVGTRA